MKKKCFICHDVSETGVYNVKQQYVCRDCLHRYTNLHVDNFKIIEREVVREIPYSDLTDSQQREACIGFIHILLDQKLAPRVFPTLQRYIKKGYSWIGIIRAMEWFYIVKKNNVALAKGGVGIVPYVYEEAQAYYEKLNKSLEKLYKEQILPEDDSVEKVFVKRKKS